jgi:uncharacterized protein YciI
MTDDSEDGAVSRKDAMLYVIIGHDSPNAKELRPQLRARHLEHLDEFDKRGRIVLAGPLTDGYGSLIVLEADDIEEVRRIAEADPYRQGGVFEQVEIHPFLQVLPGRDR